MLGVHAPELPIGRFGKSTSLGGNRVILAIRRLKNSEICDLNDHRLSVY